MNWWEITLAALGYAAVMRPVAGHLAYKDAARYPSQNGVPDHLDWEKGWLVAIVWPLAVVWIIVRAAIPVAARPLPAIGAERRYHDRKRRERHEAELREREQRIRDAERELGIGL